jgi:hypothetical protein
MDNEPSEYGLEFLLAFDGRIHHLEDGYWIKFEIKRAEATKKRPHGLSYAFTLHAPDGTRLVGFDNAHGVPARGSRSRYRRRPATTGTGRRPTQEGPTRSRTPILCSRTSSGRSGGF